MWVGEGVCARSHRTPLYIRFEPEVDHGLRVTAGYLTAVGYETVGYG
jgi:hypothetical protein